MNLPRPEDRVSRPPSPVSCLALAGVVPASRLERPPAPVVSGGLGALDELVGGLPRGALTEICGPASSGRSSLLLAVLAEATRRQELCALVDTSDCFDPLSAAAAGIDLDRLLWVRCGGGFPVSGVRGSQGSHPSADPKSKIRDSCLSRLEQALKVTDLLLQGGGFGVVAVDMASIPPEYARRVPLASWFRFRRAVEHTPTVLLVLEQEPTAKTCASLVLRTTPVPASSARSRAAVPGPAEVRQTVPEIDASPAHGQLLYGIRVQVEVMQSRGNGKKPVGSVKFTAQSLAGNR